MFSARWKRVFTALIVASAIMMAAGPALAARDYLVVQTWGGADTEAFNEAFFKPFEKETGIEVKAVVAGSDVGAKLMAMQKADNVEWDIITGSWTPFNKGLYEKGLLEKIDYGIVTDTQDLVKGAARDFGVALFLEGICLAYNTEHFKDKQPTGWKDYFDVKNFPGPRSIANWGEPYDMLLIAEIAAGIAPENGFPIDFDKAFAMLDKAKPEIKVWYTSGEQLMQPMIDQSVVMALSTDGRAKMAKSMGAPMAMVFDQAFYHLTWNSVVKGTPLKKEAMQLINYMCRPDRQAVFSQMRFMATTNRKTLEHLPEDVQADQITAPKYEGKVFSIADLPNFEWTTENMQTIEEKWGFWIAK